MTIPVALYGIDFIEEALAQAHAILLMWRVYSGQEEMKEELLQGWSASDIGERIAYALLERQGFDMEALEAAGERAFPGTEGDYGVRDLAALEAQRVGWDPACGEDPEIDGKHGGLCPGCRIRKVGLNQEMHL